MCTWISKFSVKGAVADNILILVMRIILVLVNLSQSFLIILVFVIKMSPNTDFVCLKYWLRSECWRYLAIEGTEQVLEMFL